MNQVEVQKLVKELNALTTQILNTGKGVSALQKGSLENLMERLYSVMTVDSTNTNVVTKKETISPVRVEETREKPIETVVKSNIVNTIIDEIDSVFSPTPAKPKVKRNSTNLLTVNEKIMFSKVLFKGDENALIRSIEKLQNLHSSERALDYFKQVLKPKFSENNYDQEVIAEFEHLIPRLFT